MGTLYPTETRHPSTDEIEDTRILIEKTRSIFATEFARYKPTPPTFLDKDPAELHSILQAMRAQRQSLTMTVRSGVENVRFCVEDVLRRNIAGDLMETGVWKGGLTILMRGILMAHGVSDRKVWVADSFEGLPEPDPETQLADAVTYHLLESADQLRIPLDEVRSNFSRYNLLDEQVRFLPGWFRETLPKVPINRLAVLRLDGDWYDSTMIPLRHLYPKLSAGGYVIIDDYGLPLGCRQAVDEYRRIHGVTEPIQWINQQTVFWQRRARASKVDL